MVVEDIEVSSINDDVSLSPRKKRKILAALEEKNIATNKDLINDAKLDINNNSIEINSSHESLMSILSGLIQNDLFLLLIYINEINIYQI